MSALPRQLPGAVFAGDFKIVRALKEGGMGAVYVAEQLSTGAMRAIKLMHPQYVADDAMRRRFEQEARVGARIQSDYVVDVIAAGVDAATGSPSIAMELLDGEDLSDHVKRVGRMAPRDVLGVMRMLCHAVAAAHDAGIVHRDLKPENVFLARSRRPGEAFTAKVLDFGIARTVSDVRATGTAALGTPLWMAPEQCARTSQIGPTTDVWALGLIAFYLLTASWYWRTAYGETASLTEFLHELTLGALDPASLRAADLGLGVLPAGFDAWFARCVVRDASSRFSDARAAFAALEPVLAADGPGAAAFAVAGTVQVSAAALPPPAVKAARPFYVGTATEKGLAAALPAPVPLPALPVTAPATSVTRDTTPPRRRAWPALALVPLIALAAGAWWVQTSRHAPTPAVATPAPPPPPPATPPAASCDLPEDPEVRAVAHDVAAESPMVIIPGAVFSLGYARGAVDERPVHDVSFPTFLIQIDEVTVAQYERCVSVGKCSAAGTDDFCNSGRPGRMHNPINCVSQPQAFVYCDWLGRRMPTEEEWEFAASGKSKRLYAWGNSAPAGRLCWARGDAGTCDVSSFDGGSTPEGLHDMTGNVWEWTTSDYCPYDGSYCRRDQKVARGGGWFSSDANVVRTQVRQGYDPDVQSANVGFRCVKSL